MIRYLNDSMFHNKTLKIGKGYMLVPLKYPKFYGTSFMKYVIFVDDNTQVFLTEDELHKSFYTPKEEV